MRSIFRSVVAFVAMSIGFSAGTRAATPLEFTFSGTFTQTTGTVHAVGAPFMSTLIFDPATPDELNEDPLRGRYGYISWSCPSHTSTPKFFNNVPSGIGSIRTALFTGGEDDVWELDFRGDTPFNYIMRIGFPADTFSTDGLPS